MPFVNGQFQGDGQSIMQRLFELQKAQDAMQQMKAKRDLEQQRKQILSESYTPGQEARTEYFASNPLINLFGPQQDMQNLVSASPKPANFVERATARPRDGAAEALALIPDVSTTTTEAKPAAFDVKGAIARLYGIGDLEGAQSLINDQYKDALGSKAASGGSSEKWYGNSKTIKGPDGKLYNQLLSSAGNVKLVPVDGDMTGELKQMDIGGKKVWVNSYTGEPVKEFDVTPTDYQAFQMSPERQAAVESAKTTAGEQAKAGVQRDTGNAEKQTDIDSQVAMIERLEDMAANGFNGSTWGDRLKQAGTTATGIGADSADYINTKNMQLVAKRLLLAAKPKGSGNPTEGEWKMYGQTIADPSDYPDSKSYLAALANYKAVLTGQAPFPEKYRQKPTTSKPQQGKPAASAPMPALPNPAQHNGRIIRDTSTGIRYQSNGSQWMRVK